MSARRARITPTPIARYTITATITANTRSRAADVPIITSETTVKIVLTATSHKAATAIQMLRPFSEGTRYWPNSLIALSNPGLAASRS